MRGFEICFVVLNVVDLCFNFNRPRIWKDKLIVSRKEILVLYSRSELPLDIVEVFV